MKFGLRIPSLEKRIFSRLSIKRVARHRVGLKMLHGFGFITNSKKFAFNKIYNKTSYSVDKFIKTRNKKMMAKVNQDVFDNRKNLLVISAAVLLSIIAWPFGIVLISYLIVKQSNKTKTISGVQNTTATSNNKINTKTENNSQLPASISIPEPTKSLLWLTNEDVSKIESANAIEIAVEVGANGINFTNSKDNPNFFAEPSLIWTQLPIESNNDLEESPMYYPTYSGLSHKHRFQYLNWLKDITKETNLSYVFLYFYGLERHLLVGNYDLAVDEILRLMKFHNKRSFNSYVTDSLIASSVFRKRPDILERAPFLLDDVSDLSLALKTLKNQSLSAKNIINLSSRVGFSNKRYIRLYPDLFEKELQSKINEFEKINGALLDQANYNSLTKGETMVFANLSIPDRLRTIKFPQILEDVRFKSILIDLLKDTHDEIKSRKKENTI